jgi:modification methylase
MSNPKSYKFDPFIRQVLGRHPAYQQLKEQIQRDRRVTDAIIIGDADGIVYDGEARIRAHAELTAAGLNLGPIPELRVPFANQDDAIRYLLNRQGAQRQMTPNRRAWLWIKANERKLGEWRSAGKRNQATYGSGDKEELSAHAPEAAEGADGHAPKADRIDVRQALSVAAGVGVKVAGAALKIHHYLQETDHPKINEFRDLQRSFEAESFTYRQVEHYFKNIEEEAAEDARRNNNIAQSLPQADQSPGGEAVEIATHTAPQLIVPNSLTVTDWMTGIRRVQPGSVSLVTSSPPYPLEEYSYNGSNPYDGNYAAYLAWLKEGYQALFSALRSGGRVALQIDSVSAIHKPTGHSITLPLYKDTHRLMEEAGFTFWYEITWYKQTTTGKRGRIRWGSPYSASAPVVRRTHEYILVFFKDTPVLEGDDVDNTILRDEFRRFTLSQWYVPPETQKFRSASGVTHPCPFSIDLPYRLIQLLTRKGDTVLDPFNGAGTSTLAAHCLGRRYIGFDNQGEFVEIAQARLNEVSNLTPSERLAWVRGKLFRPNYGERKDGWGPSNHNGSNFKRRWHGKGPSAD